MHQLLKTLYNTGRPIHNTVSHCYCFRGIWLLFLHHLLLTQNDEDTSISKDNFLRMGKDGSTCKIPVNNDLIIIYLCNYMYKKWALKLIMLEINIRCYFQLYCYFISYPCALRISINAMQTRNPVVVAAGYFLYFHLSTMT